MHWNKSKAPTQPQLLGVPALLEAVRSGFAAGSQLLSSPHRPAHAAGVTPSQKQSAGNSCDKQLRFCYKKECQQALCSSLFREDHVACPSKMLCWPKL